MPILERSYPLERWAVWKDGLLDTLSAGDVLTALHCGLDQIRNGWKGLLNHNQDDARFTRDSRREGRDTYDWTVCDCAVERRHY